MEISQKKGYSCGGPHNKDYGILGFYCLFRTTTIVGKYDCWVIGRRGLRGTAYDSLRLYTTVSPKQYILNPNLLILVREYRDMLYRGYIRIHSDCIVLVLTENQ